jgi:hypothetical protein
VAKDETVMDGVTPRSDERTIAAVNLSGTGCCGARRSSSTTNTLLPTSYVDPDDCGAPQTSTSLTPITVGSPRLGNDRRARVS